ncbi:hypothetical protein PRIPAC_93113 [Pristionchus pacificus]|nr:hypothetical protein PRIPAC_93113 [Pristionchus pacificus]
MRVCRDFDTFHEGFKIEVNIETEDDGKSWRLRPIVDFFAPRDRILLIGEDKQKIYVNKEFLASQSTYFECLFNSDFKEKNMTEIPIGDVEYEEFFNIIRIVYNRDDASLTDENVYRVLELANRFDLKLPRSEGRMAAPPHEKECTTISMIAEEWRKDQTEQFSHVHRINGYPWRLRLYAKRNELRLEVICDKSSEAELWKCRAVATMTKPFVHTETLSFNNCARRNCLVTLFTDARKIQFRTRLVVRIETNDDGKMWRLRPVLDPFVPYDGVIVVGTRNISVNRKSLAALSPFFFKLFYGNFNEQFHNVISIADVEFDEFSNIIAIIYGWDSASLTGENVHRMLRLADKLELKIVEDKIANFLFTVDSQENSYFGSI